jgi:hypothetical protein
MPATAAKAPGVPLCRVRLGGHASHLSQVAAGFTMLERKGLLRLEYTGLAAFKRDGLYMHGILLEARIGDAVLAYDLADGYEEILQREEFDRQLERVTFYFKRSYDPKFHEGMKNRRKMRPLGLNYYVTCPGNFMDASRPAPGGCTPEEYMSHNSYPEYRGLFLTRLWNPEGVRACVIQKLHPHLSGAEARAAADETIGQFEHMNALRAGCIRACREALGERFLGGLENSMFAQKTAPDLVLPPAETGKAAFLRRLRENFVCVTTEGLHRSAGSKLAGYCAAGGASGTDPPGCALPGGFSRGRNYIQYATPEECVSQLASLLGNVPGVHRMEAANFAYYNGYVRPDAMVLRTLREVWPGFPNDFG